jgi:uncharacterized protein HemY
VADTDGIHKEVEFMRTRLVSLLVLALALFAAAATEGQQYPIMVKIAGKLIQKYQQSTCEQLWQEKTQKASVKPQTEQQATEILRNDPQMRTAFVNKIAAPIANKMFDFGMIP